MKFNRVLDVRVNADMTMPPSVQLAERLKR